VRPKVGMGAGEEGRRGLAGGVPTNDQPGYHGVYDLSSTIIVLVFRELTYLFERFRKKKKTKE